MDVEATLILLVEGSHSSAIPEDTLELCKELARRVVAETVHSCALWEKFLVLMARAVLMVSCSPQSRIVHQNFGDLTVRDLAPPAARKQDWGELGSSSADQIIKRECNMVASALEELIETGRYDYDTVALFEYIRLNCEVWGGGALRVGCRKLRST